MGILLYHEPRTYNGVLHAALEKALGPVVTVNDADIKAGVLDGASALFMPGGPDRYYLEKLKGDGNARIRDFVGRGGTYIGICGGAYYGCREIDWKNGEIKAPRELDFFQGLARGPVPQWPVSEAVEIEGPLGQGLSYYWGGPLFEGDFKNVDVLARYASLPGKPPAVIAGRHGKGNWFLCSAHLEYDAAAIRAGNAEEGETRADHERAAAALEKGKQQRACIWRAFLSKVAPLQMKQSA